MKHALILTLILAAPAFAQEPCPNCGRFHGPSTSLSVPVLNPVILAPVAPAQPRAFQLANAKRARAGLGPLAFDAQLQAGAQLKVDKAVRLGSWRHQRDGLFYGGNAEGVGVRSNESPAACYLVHGKVRAAAAGTPAGVAMAQSRGGSWYTVLLAKNSGGGGGRLLSGEAQPVRRIVGLLRGLFGRR